MFVHVQKTRFHVAQSLAYKNGYPLPLRPQFDVGGNPLPASQLDEADLDELSNTRPTLTYGNSTKPAPVEFVPAHVAFDKKVYTIVQRVLCDSKLSIAMLISRISVMYQYSKTSVSIYLFAINNALSMCT